MKFLEQALGATLERREHIAGGCNACTYHVKFVEEARQTASARFDEEAAVGVEGMAAAGVGSTRSSETAGTAATPHLMKHEQEKA